jgi:hypothetical protein
VFKKVKDETIYPNGEHELLCWSGNCQTQIVNDVEFYVEKVGDNGSVKKYSENFPEPAKSQVYGFGRELSDGKYMSIKIDNDIWFKKSAGSKNITLKIILLNQGSGTVKVDFKKSDGSVYTETITKGFGLGSVDSFVEIVRNIQGVTFNGGLNDGGDVVVRSEGGTTTLHMLEIKTGSVVTSGDTLPETATPTSVSNNKCDNSCGVCGVRLANGSCVYDWGNAKYKLNCCHMACVNNVCQYINGGGSYDCQTCSSSTTTCAGKGQGDGNCDGKINIGDFEIWKVEFIQKGTQRTADFDGDGKVTILDFGVWKVGFLK